LTNFEYGEEFLTIFVDYNKAFDIVKRDEIWKSLERKRTAADLLRKLKNTCKNTINCITQIRGGQHGLREDQK
jgi:uncharacterized pyridoxal phosphate-containing UPF0001 family protein